MLSYGTLITYNPIRLSIGTIRKPLLQDISDLTFDTFYYYEYLMKMKVEDYYEDIVKDEAVKQQFEKLSLEEKSQMVIYDLVMDNEDLRMAFCDMFNFFFVEKVIVDEEIFGEWLFIILDQAENQEQNICGVIMRDNFQGVLQIIQEICCIYNEEEDITKLKFKSKSAKKLYLRGLKAKREAAKKNKNKDSSLPNIISSINAKHHSLNFTNIYNLTVFQLIDCFQRMKTNAVYDITSRGVSVWGDEKKTFDFSMWHKNYYENEN